MDRFVIKTLLVTTTLITTVCTMELGGEDFFMPMNPSPAHIQIEAFFNENDNFRPVVIQPKKKFKNRDMDAALSLIQLSLDIDRK